MSRYNPGEDLYKAAEELRTVEHASMSVEVFRTRFVRRFWEGDPTAYQDWMGVVGKPFRRCDLVERGQKVGEVPPLALQPDTHETDGGRYSLFERLTTLQNHIKRLPQAEKQLTERALAELIPTAQVNQDLLKEWDALFKAFGYPGYLQETPEADDTAPDPTVTFDGYEEL